MASRARPMPRPICDTSRKRMWPSIVDSRETAALRFGTAACPVGHVRQHLAGFHQSRRPQQSREPITLPAKRPVVTDVVCLDGRGGIRPKQTLVLGTSRARTFHRPSWPWRPGCRLQSRHVRAAFSAAGLAPLYPYCFQWLSNLTPANLDGSVNRYLFFPLQYVKKCLDRTI
jgi:hypothetical protein